MKIHELVYDPTKGHDVAVGIKVDYDPSIYETKEAAARGLYEALKKLNADLGGPDGEVALFEPERTKKYSGEAAWCVVWESGPFEWAVSAYVSGPWGYCEPYHSFDLHFTD